MSHREIVQSGKGGTDLFVYAHIDPTLIKAEVGAGTDDTVVTELWGLGTSAYVPVLASYGGWRKFVTDLGAACGGMSFERTCITCWSAGGGFGLEVLAQAHREGGAAKDLPDAMVFLDAIYGSKPVGSKPGDGRVVWTDHLEAAFRYALAAARGDGICVLIHSGIWTPYASSGEVANAIVARLEERLGPLPDDTTLTAADLDGHPYVSAKSIGGLHVVAFAGKTAGEHVTEAHLFDAIWRRWVPWSTPAATTSSAPVESAPLPILKRGSSGAFVSAWQSALTKFGFAVTVDGAFGPGTESATRAFQTWATGLGGSPIAADGVVGPATRRAATRLAGRTREPTTLPAPPFPQLSDAERDRLFGRMTFVSAATPSMPDAITILGSWVVDNIVRVQIPQLVGRGIIAAPADGRIYFHRRAVPQLLALFEAWDEAGLLPLIRSWGGSWAPRFVRGRPGVLSRHAHGLAFDVNAGWNPLGAPAHEGEGSTMPLVQLARAHGFFWGGDFASRPDPMHFELGKLDEEGG